MRPREASRKARLTRAALFDAGDTLLRPRAAGGDARGVVLARLSSRYGPRDWYRELLDADLLTELLHDDPEEPLRQRTLAVLARWLATRGADVSGVDLDELRRLAEAPRALSAELAPGARELLTHLRDRGMRVVIVSNTLWTGDDDLRADLPAIGLGGVVDGVVTSHTTGYRKPHRAIFERALALADARPEEAFMVGDEPYQDVFGAQRSGIRGVWLRHPPPRPHPVGAPRDFDVRPDAEIRSLHELREVVDRWEAR